MKYRIFLALLLFFLSGLALQSAPLRVGVSGSPPFVAFTGETQSDKQGKLTNAKAEGISIDIWKEISTEAGLKSQLIPYKSVETLLKALRRNEIDLAVGPISITAERHTWAAFTQPYYSSTMGILTHKGSASLWKSIKPFIRKTFLLGVITLIAILFLVGNVIWFFERIDNDAFPKTYWSGVGNGMWLAVVTFTTVGYGDLTPITRSGRIIIGAWMITALITASSLTAGIASSFTLLSLRYSSIEKPESLDGEIVAVVRGTTGANFARDHGAALLQHDTLNDAVSALGKGRAVAVTFDYPGLKHFVKKYPKNTMDVIQVYSEAQNYGFCMKQGNPHLKKINLALLRTAENDRLQKILQNWGVD